MRKPQWLRPRLIISFPSSTTMLRRRYNWDLGVLFRLLMFCSSHPETFKGCSVVDSDIKFYEIHQSASRNGPIKLWTVPYLSLEACRLPIVLSVLATTIKHLPVAGTLSLILANVVISMKSTYIPYHYILLGPLNPAQDLQYLVSEARLHR